MLVMDAFSRALELVDNGVLVDTLPADMQWQLCICLFQACHRSLLTQDPDGSWNRMPEQTAYAILTLSNSRKLCFLKEFTDQIETAITSGVSFLASCDLGSSEQNWTSKTAYRVDLVANAYHLAALRAAEIPTQAFYSIGRLTDTALPIPQAEGFLKLLSKTPLCSSLPKWQVRASLVESSLFVPLLRARRSEVFERDENRIAKDDYLAIIPFTWIHCSNAKRLFVSNSLLYEMMVISMLGYQIDEYVETVLDPHFAEDPAALHDLIETVVSQVSEAAPNAEEIRAHSAAERPQTPVTTRHDSGHSTPSGEIVTPPLDTKGPSDTVELPIKTSINIRTTLSKFCAHILRHPAVVTSHANDQSALRRELLSFLHAHATQTTDNRQLRQQAPPSGGGSARLTTFHDPHRRPFCHWVRTTAADHVACAYSFAFMSCLLASSLGAAGVEVFSTVREKYFAAATVRHLTTACRMYNDLGSIARDEAEKNLNSVHFAEFGGGEIVADDGHAAVETRKEALLTLARFEDECFRHALSRLREEVERPKASAKTSSSTPFDAFSKRKVDLVEFFCEVTDTYDQLYLVKDLSSRIK